MPYDKYTMLKRQHEYVCSENKRLHEMIDRLLAENAELRMEVKIWRKRDRIYNDMVNKRTHRYVIYF